MIDKLGKRFARNTLAILFGFLLVETCQACSVCAVGKEEARAAYYATTAVLSFLPLIMIGGVVYYIFKRSGRSSDDRRR